MQKNLGLHNVKDITETVAACLKGWLTARASERALRSR